MRLLFFIFCLLFVKYPIQHCEILLLNLKKLDEENEQVELKKKKKDMNMEKKKSSQLIIPIPPPPRLNVFFTQENEFTDSFPSFQNNISFFGLDYNATFSSPSIINYVPHYNDSQNTLSICSFSADRYMTSNDFNSLQYFLHLSYFIIPLIRSLCYFFIIF
jgi:hypothetical protein